MVFFPLRVIYTNEDNLAMKVSDDEHMYVSNDLFKAND
jgi:hypothetical protein